MERNSNENLDLNKHLESAHEYVTRCVFIILRDMATRDTITNELRINLKSRDFMVITPNQKTGYYQDQLVDYITLREPNEIYFTFYNESRLVHIDDCMCGDTLIRLTRLIEDITNKSI